MDQEEFRYSRLFINKNEKERFITIKRSLEDLLKDELSGFADENKINAINLCIDEINNLIKKQDNDTFSSNQNSQLNEAERKNSLTTLVEDSTMENGSSSGTSELKTKSDTNVNFDELKKDINSTGEYLYQDYYAENYYLHPIDFNILLVEYGSPESFPTQINVSLQ